MVTNAILSSLPTFYLRTYGAIEILDKSRRIGVPKSKGGLGITNLAVQNEDFSRQKK
jgi:hypothetical protein